MSKSVKIAVLSDIHGNYIALKKCVDYALDRGIQKFIFLGDYVGDLAYPGKTMDMLYDFQQKYECIFIKGNKEGYWLNYRKNGEQGWKDGDSTTGTLLYGYRNLTERDFAFFESLSHVQRIAYEGLPDITLCHGSPEQVNEQMLPGKEKTLEVMEKEENDYILCGHTHIQGKIVHGEKVLLNPGSVGMPLASDGKAQFLILHGTEGRWQEEFISLEYDVDKVIRELQESELDKAAPFWYKVTVNSLKAGKKAQSHGTVLARAMAICQEQTGKCNWPNIPESCWAQAFQELIG